MKWLGFDGLWAWADVLASGLVTGYFLSVVIHRDGFETALWGTMCGVFFIRLLFALSIVVWPKKKEKQ